MQNVQTKTPEEIELGDTDLATTFKATKDIRDKYVLSRLAWDLGIIEEIKFQGEKHCLHLEIKV